MTHLPVEAMPLSASAYHRRLHETELWFCIESLTSQFLRALSRFLSVFVMPGRTIRPRHTDYDTTLSFVEQIKDVRCGL
jgi:hypothetical protein